MRAQRRLPVRPRVVLVMTANALSAFVLSAFVLSACALLPRRVAAPSPVAVNARAIADSVTTELLASGVTLHRLVNNAAPWRASVLEVDLRTCVSFQAVKGGSTAVGRRTTSALLASIDASLRPIAAVNADFFLFAPPGVPVGPHIENGRLVSGPIDRGVFATDSAGRPFIGRLSISAELRSTRATIHVSSWNRPAARNIGVVDANWGIPLDTAVARSAWLLSPIMVPPVGPPVMPAGQLTPSVPAGYLERLNAPAYVASPLPTWRGGVVTGDTLLLVGLRTPGGGSAPVQPGDTLRVQRFYSPLRPQQAVGGMPELVRDSVVRGAVDSVNDAGFRGLNPRTAVGYGSDGKRVLIAVIDGRQPTYSVGMSLRHTAELFRSLGATHAINLDGGGSSAMVVTDARAPKGSRLVTHPSDAAGERAVANALAVLKSCR